MMTKSIITMTPVVLARSLRFASSTPRVLRETGFEAQWRKMNEKERDLAEKDFEHLAKEDWRKLTFEQKRALFCIAYDSPVIKDPYEGWKIAGGVAIGLAVSVGAFALARSFANPPPKTMSPEYKKAETEYLVSHNVNPIRGVSARHRKALEEEAELQQAED